MVVVAEAASDSGAALLLTRATYSTEVSGATYGDAHTKGLAETLAGNSHMRLSTIAVTAAPPAEVALARLPWGKRTLELSLEANA